jgi:hypothetical protein
MVAVIIHAKGYSMPVKTSSSTSKSKSKKRGGIQITGDGKYPLVPIDNIEIVERPKPGEESEKLFFNPRELSSFTPESMAELHLSIRTDGLQQPPLVRAFTKGDDVIKVELIAGERRFRSVQYIIEHDLPCFDEDCKRPKKFEQGQTVICKGHFSEVVSHGDKVTVQILDANNKLTDEQRDYDTNDVYPTVSGALLYSRIPCRVAYDISDARALRLAFAENDKSKSLSTREEIVLVERLDRRGLKVAEIAEHLGTNETWVSQTANFRTSLPEDALDCLLKGNMKRHTAVKIMGYKPEDRDGLWKSTIEAEAEETAAAIALADNESIQAEDEELSVLADKKKALKAGDTKSANKLGRTAASLSTKASKARERKERAESESGQIKTGHVQKGAAKAGLSPKKAKMLPKEEIEECYISAMEEYLDGESVDPICGEEVPADLAAIVRLTALAILNGNRDSLSPIRQFMIEQDRWRVKKSKKLIDDEGDDEDDEDDEEEAFLDEEGPSEDELEYLDDFEDDDFEDDES